MPDELDARLTAALADRYALERELGRGGMATVYLARDLKHDRAVAVKVLRPELAVSLSAERFVREIHIAAQLQHPHILPLLNSGEAAGLLYYVMPYVEGESLRAKLEREGEIPVEEATRILREVVDALAYAHARGVVHRDIKPDNIMLTSQHALVMDFGIARAVSATAEPGALTTAGLAIGTPAYMAPEQAAGDPRVDGRADIYAAGVVAYEMLSGRPLFEGVTPQEVLTAQLTQVPEDLSVLRPSLPPALAELVMRCLEKKPADRWQTAAELLPELAAVPTPGRGSRAARRTRRRWLGTWRRRVLVAGLGVLVLGAAGTWAVRARRAAGLEPQRVVVAPFENATGDTALSRLGRLAADEITQGLARANIPGLAAPSAPLDSTGRGDQGSGEARLLRLAKAAGARLVVTGSYYRLGDSLRFQARISDVATGELIAALASIIGPARNPLGTVDELRQRVMGALAVHVTSGVVTWGAETSRPPVYQAFLAYQMGIAALAAARGEWMDPWYAARADFHRAFLLDSTFALALLWEGMAEYVISPNGAWRGDTIVGRLERMRESLTRAGQLRLDWLQRILSDQDLELAYAIAQQLVEASSGDVWAKAELAGDALRVNRPREALRIFKSLEAVADRWSPLAGGDYWGTQAVALHMVGDFEEELRIARLGRVAGSRHYLTEYAGLRALAALGRYGELQVALDEAVSRTQNPGWVGWYYMNAGSEVMYHVRRDSGLAILRRGIALLRSWGARGADSLEANRRGVLAYLLYYVGDWEGCAAEWRGLEQPRIVDERPCTPWLLAARRGDRAEAQRLLAKADSGLQGERARARSWALLAHARVAAILGDREAAMTYLRQAMPSIGFDLDLIILDADIDFDSLRDYPPFVELLRPKG